MSKSMTVTNAMLLPIFSFEARFPRAASPESWFQSVHTLSVPKARFILQRYTTVPASATMSQPDPAIKCADNETLVQVADLGKSIE
jgi:hypothetical protein